MLSSGTRWYYGRRTKKPNDENEEEASKVIEEQALNDFSAMRNKITFERLTRNCDEIFRKVQRVK